MQGVQCSTLLFVSLLVLLLLLLLAPWLFSFVGLHHDTMHGLPNFVAGMSCWGVW